MLTLRIGCRDIRDSVFFTKTRCKCTCQANLCHELSHYELQRIVFLLQYIVLFVYFCHIGRHHLDRATQSTTVTEFGQPCVELWQNP